MGTGVGVGGTGVGGIGVGVGFGLGVGVGFGVGVAVGLTGACVGSTFTWIVGAVLALCCDALGLAMAIEQVHMDRTTNKPTHPMPSLPKRLRRLYQATRRWCGMGLGV